MNVSTKNLGAALALAAGLCLSATAKADNVFWTTWTSSTPNGPASGTATGAIAGLGGVTVSYSGQNNGTSGTNNPNWLYASSFEGGTVTNAPNVAVGENAVRLNGGQSYTETVTFGQGLKNPEFAIWSLGGGSTPASFLFNSNVTLEAGGANAEYGGSSILVNGSSLFGATGKTVTGVEGNGVVQITNPYVTSIAFTTPQTEVFYAFTVGSSSLGSQPSATPEPSSFALLGTGLAGLGGLVKRRFKRV